MNAIQLMKAQLKWAHETLDATASGTTAEQLHFSAIGKALPVGAAYAHAVMGEDVTISTMLAHKKTVYEENGDTGLSSPMPSMAKWNEHEQWAKSVKVNIELFKKYAQRVYAATDEYLSTLKDEDLDTELEIPGMGKMTLANIISNFLVLHAANLAGEISAAKGFQGLKGYPW